MKTNAVRLRIPSNTATIRGRGSRAHIEISFGGGGCRNSLRRLCVMNILGSTDGVLFISPIFDNFPGQLSYEFSFCAMPLLLIFMPYLPFDYHHSSLQSWRNSIGVDF